MSASFFDRRTVAASSGLIARTLQVLLLIQIMLLFGAAWLLHEGLQLSWWLAGVFSLLLLTLARILITAHTFSLAARAASPSPRRLNFWQRCAWFWGEFYATLYSSSWGMLHCAFVKREHGPSSTLPVLLIHGYVCNSGYWQRLSAVLSAAKINHYAIDLEPVFGGIDEYVPLIQESVEAIRAATGSAQVIIVAHSMGGLAARAYMRTQGSSRIAQIITLGTPHHGTALAARGPGINSRQMEYSPDGQANVWLAQLAASESKATRALITSIYSFQDNIISPQLSSHLDGANNIALTGMGHVALALNPAVQQLVLEQIRQVSPS